LAPPPPSASRNIPPSKNPPPPTSTYQPVSKVIGNANIPQPNNNNNRPPQGITPQRTQAPNAAPTQQKAPTPSKATTPSNIGGIRLNPLWFYGEMSRSDAETRLKAFPSVNVFLIRYSSSVQSYTISKWLPAKQKFYHCIVRASPSDGKFRLEESLDKDSYPSLEDVVAKSSEVRGFTPLGLLAK